MSTPKRNIFLVVFSLFLLFPLTAYAVEWKDVIVGDTMPGWESKLLAVEDSWVIKDGMLICTGKPKERKGTIEDWGIAWIGTKKEYTDFGLEFEFKLPTGGNSGVFIRAAKIGHPTFDGMEIQILDDHTHKGFPPWNLCGALYKIADPSEKKVVRPAGEWNKMRVTVKGDHIVVILNSDKIVDANGKDYPEILKRSPRGPVGLQNHGTLIWFRNIRFADLSEKAK